MTAAMAPFAGFIHDPDGQFDVAFAGIIRRGHGVASGSAVASPYAEGTLALQIPIFLKLGVDLRGFHRGTLNVDVSPRRCVLRNADVTLRGVRWTDRIPPEDFSFFSCLIEAAGATHRAVIYRPHPETKVEHFQGDSIVEILAPFMPGAHAGMAATLWIRRNQLAVSGPP